MSDSAESVAAERVCPQCHYPHIARDRQGWFCLNGGCGRFDQPERIEGSQEGRSDG
jgi:hypothetical protein